MAAKDGNSWGWSTEPLLARFAGHASDGRQARVRVHLGKAAEELLRVSEGDGGPEILLAPRWTPEAETETRLKSSVNTRLREAMGALVTTLDRLDVRAVEINLDLPAESVPAAVCGLELALYRFKRVLKGEAPKYKIRLLHKGRLPAEKLLAAGWAVGGAANLARHLVNLPPNWLNPQTYADFLQDLFAGLKHTKLEVWDEARLKKEKMGLHLGVGQGSATPPCLVHIRYRPSGAKGAPLAFVGKGITFDTGGVDLKPAAGMRLMKKDMGGSAAVAALAYWAAMSGWKQSADFYLALAENSVDGTAFRPSDVLIARNGLAVEIHNTDAEGRLVLADALDVAVTAKEKPRTVINVATLTGAIKTALGASVAGLFSNDARLASTLSAAGQEAGDWMWHMPLVQRYRAQLNSGFADLANASDGFGGAITAALFLERFVKDVSWAHLDIYAWKDSAEGACVESGGSGQAVFALVEWAQGL
jgi:leucyl aminopeptidase